MLYIITPCSRPENLLTILNTIPKECQWIIGYDGKNGIIPFIPNAIIMNCEDNGFFGTKARNHILNTFKFDDKDNILFHDDDNIIHPLFYKTISSILDNDFSIMCWGQLHKNSSIRLFPTNNPKINHIDTASYLIKWKYNKTVRHNTELYYHDGLYAEDCAKNGPVYTIDEYISFYNALI